MDAVRNATGSGTETQLVLAAARARLVRPEQIGVMRREVQDDRDGDVDAAAVTHAQTVAHTAAGTAAQGVQAAAAGGSVESTRAADDAARKSFFGMLIQNGICPVQLYEDLLVSLMDRGDEEYDRSKAFRGVGPGLAVDTTA